MADHNKSRVDILASTGSSFLAARHHGSTALGLAFFHSFFVITVIRFHVITFIRLISSRLGAREPGSEQLR